jgi:hypothetical protein
VTVANDEMGEREKVRRVAEREREGVHTEREREREREREYFLLLNNRVGSEVAVV